MIEIRSFLRRNIVAILIFIYFVRFAIPLGVYRLTLTFFFYYFTIYLVVGLLVSIGIWGIAGLIKTKHQNKSVNPQHRYFLLLAIFGLALFGLSLLSRYAYDHKKFDSTIWKNQKVSLDWDINLITLRQRMTNDLVENVLPGLDKNKVESLLDIPNDVWEPEEGGVNFLYVLGPERGLGVDFECLLIHFDETGYYQSHKTFGNCG